MAAATGPPHPGVFRISEELLLFLGHAGGAEVAAGAAGRWGTPSGPHAAENPAAGAACALPTVHGAAEPQRASQASPGADGVSSSALSLF